MKLAVSQIAWLPEQDEEALSVLVEYGYAGLEIAPPRVAGDAPYTQPDAAHAYAKALAFSYGLSLCSMQSIWYGQTGSMFGPERQALLEYTKKAILFAKAGGIGNLVFGNPKNRVKPEGLDDGSALSFFKELGDFAAQNGTVLALEANPPVYGTNFMNTTADAFAIAYRTKSPGCKVNLDVGTIIIGEESLAPLSGHIGNINHVHISEPGLAMIEQRKLHRELAAILREENFEGYVSIEMKQQPLKNLIKAARYVAEVFG